MSSIQSPKIAPPSLSTLRRVPKPILKSTSAPASAGKKLVDTTVYPKLEKPKITKSFFEKNMFPILIVGLGVSYLVLRKTKK